MNKYIIALLEKYSRVGILLDTKILLLYFVGSFDPELIPKFERTRTYTREDFCILHQFLSPFKKVVTTPNILTEVSNFSGQLADYLHPEYFEHFASKIMLLDEHYLPSADISSANEFKQFGLTDIGIFLLAKGKYLVMTDDLPLFSYLQRKGVDAINFNHIRVWE
jgi:hypothetical protein